VSILILAHSILDLLSALTQLIDASNLLFTYTSHTEFLYVYDVVERHDVR